MKKQTKSIREQKHTYISYLEWSPQGQNFSRVVLSTDNITSYDVDQVNKPAKTHLLRHISLTVILLSVIISCREGKGHDKDFNERGSCDEELQFFVMSEIMAASCFSLILCQLFV